ncbi:MAG: hypothetical protein WCG40_00650 [Actinomycetes bacterium]
MGVLSYLRARGIKDGLARGQRGWFILGVVLWTARLLRRLARRTPQLVSSEVLRPGQSMSISSLEPERRTKRRDRKSLS